MSWQASRWARDQVTGSPAAKSVLLILAEQASAEDAACTISTAFIAERTEMARTTVIKALGVLEELRLVARSRRMNPTTGHRMSDEINLALPVPLGPRDRLREGDQSPSGGLGPKSVSVGTKVRLSGDQSPSGGPHIDKGLGKGLEKGKRATARRPFPIEKGFPDQEAIERERSFLQEKGWNIDASLEAEKFRSHALNKGRVGKDWRAAFHGWIVKAIQFAPLTARATPVIDAPTAPSPTPWRSRLKAFRDPANGHWNDTDWGPRPGKLGCIAPAGLVAEFGFGPANVVPIGRAANG